MAKMNENGNNYNKDDYVRQCKAFDDMKIQIENIAIDTVIPTRVGFKMLSDAPAFEFNPIHQIWFKEGKEINNIYISSDNSGDALLL
ncbi:hypothetical protein FE392_19200 [Xenorhabdus sp. 12]|uniref:Uncharacterized protein n=1 Tax=Xenorhabdus santafensis TaxID=2582833 RepID=A0ABU4SF11_9GAMM|nr:hypothetical protein [Xenorhabdus sp. 12]MDX7989393.1 hypothetical protein [Xenorhabdus sp. 12]